MKSFKFSSLFLVLFVALSNYTIAQDSTNFVRSSVSYRVVETFGPKPNNVDIFPDYCLDFQADPKAQGTCSSGSSPYGVEYETFLDLLATAYNEGRGGVIDFENPIFGVPLVTEDKTAYRAMMEEFILNNPISIFEDEVKAELPELSDQDTLIEALHRQDTAALAFAESQLGDSLETNAIEAKFDRAVDANTENAILESVYVDKLIGLYGSDFSSALVFNRGEQNIIERESIVSTDQRAGPIDYKQMINSQHYNYVGLWTYSGGAYIPVSGISSHNAGVADLTIDPRDNVKVLGLAAQSVGNFQYYQGDTGVPLNPNNMRLYVEFSNGESEELAQTTRQSTGLWDIFWGVQAPEGASITRVQLRVIGRNSRTFTSIDDLSFIVEPSLPFLVSALEYDGAQGSQFYASLTFGQNPSSITVSGLPDGISFNPETNLLEGTFSQSGEFVAQVSLTNSVGTAVENVTFNVSTPVSEELVLEEVGDVSVVIRRSLPDIVVNSNLDETAIPGSITYFTTVRKLSDNSLTTLGALGLSIVDNVISGTPNSANQAGEYLVTVFARSPLSSHKIDFNLSVLIPTESPNFDSNETTDYAYISGNEIFTSLNSIGGGSATFKSSIGGLNTNDQIFSGEFSGDNFSDFLLFDGTRVAIQTYQADGSFAETVLLNGLLPDSGEVILEVADFNGDGTSDILWSNPSRNRITIWLLANDFILWAGTAIMDGGIPELVTTGNFAGDGSFIGLFKSDETHYKLVQFTEFSTLGILKSNTLDFTLEGSLSFVGSADFSGDGIEDILWLNESTGVLSLWEMNGLSTNTSFFSTDDSEQVNASAGDPFWGQEFDWSLVSAVDLSNDQKADLILRNLQTGALGLVLVDGTNPLTSIITIGDSYTELLTVGDFDGNSRNDLLVYDSFNNELIMRAVSEDLSIPSELVAQGVDFDQWISPVLVQNTEQSKSNSLGWFGNYTFANFDWVYIDGWGWAYQPTYVESSQALIIFDPALGFLLTSESVYPNMYQFSRNSWIYFNEGTMNPRTFYDYNRRRVLTEDRL